MVQKAQQIFNDRYQNAARKQNYPRRQKDIQMMPRQRNQISNYNNNDPNLEEEMDELIRTIEEMQSIINGQKNEIKNNRNELSRKNKEINFLKNELNNAQKELDDKIIEHENGKERSVVIRSIINRLSNTSLNLLHFLILKSL